MIRYVAFALVAVFVIGTIGSASAIIQTTRGSDYINVLDTISGKGTWQSAPAWMPSGNGFAPYKYSEGSTWVKVETMQGSYVFDKNSCSISFYNGGTISGSPVIKSDSYVVKASLGNSGVWNSVGVINNAACQTNVIQNGDSIEIDGVKNVTGAGQFKIQYIKNNGEFLKTTLSATNSNPAWTNYHIGLTQTMQLPQFITLGNATYDLSQHNGTVLDRNWITNHKAQLVALTKNVRFDMGLGWNNVNQITIYWINNQASIAIDYTYNTPILSPGNTISVDPVFGYSTGTSNFYADDTQISTACKSPATSSAGYWNIYKGISTNNDGCFMATGYWSLASLPTTIYVTNSSLQFNVTAVTNPINCDYVKMNHSNPTTDTLTNIWGNLTSNAAYVSDSSACTVTTVRKQLILGTAANNDITNMRDNGTNYFAVGMRFHTMVRDASNHQTKATNISNNDLALKISYNIYPTTFNVRTLHNNNSTILANANVTISNSTFKNSQIVNSTGWYHYANTAISTLQNVTIKDVSTNFVVNKAFNLAINVPPDTYTKTFNTNLFDLACSGAGSDSKFQFAANSTNGHTLSYTSSPSCISNHNITSTAKFTAVGNKPNSYTTSLYWKSLNTTFDNWMPSKITVNGTSQSFTYNNTTKTANVTGISVGTGLQTKFLRFSIQTDNVTSAPRNIITTPLSVSSIKINFDFPLYNHGSSVTGYQITRNGTVIANNTGTTTLNYNDTGLSSAHQQTYSVKAWNRIGSSPASSNSSSTTYEAITAVVTLNKTIVGDAIGISPIIHLTAGIPTPTITTEKIYNGTTLRVTTTPGTSAPAKGTTGYGPAVYDAYLSASNSNYTIGVILSNTVGTVTINSTNSTGLVTRSYDPNYFTATTASLGQVNYTISRSTPGLITLDANRQVSGATFPMECLYQTATQAMLGGHTGTWVNKTDIGLWHQIQSVSPNQVYYITCFDPGDELFHTSSLVNGSFILFGISGFDSTFGAFLGVPVGVFFIVMAAALGNRRTAPMWVVIILAIAGLMATIGFFTLDQNIWYLAIIAGLLGLFVGRKLF